MSWFNKSAKKLAEERETPEKILERIRPIQEFVGDLGEKGGIFTQIRTLRTIPRFQTAVPAVLNEVSKINMRITTKTLEIRREFIQAKRFLNNINSVPNIEQRKTLYGNVISHFDKIKEMARGIKNDASFLKKYLKEHQIATFPADNIEEFSKSMIGIVA